MSDYLSFDMIKCINFFDFVYFLEDSKISLWDYLTFIPSCFWLKAKNGSTKDLMMYLITLFVIIVFKIHCCQLEFQYGKCPEGVSFFLWCFFFLKTQMNALLLLSNKDLISLWLSSKLLEVRFQKPQMMYKGPRNMFTVFFKC